MKLADIMQLPSKTIRTVMECAGDDGEFLPLAEERRHQTDTSEAPEGAGRWNQMGSADGKRPDRRASGRCGSHHLLGERRGMDRYAIEERSRNGRYAKGRGKLRYFVGYDKGRPDPTPQYAAATGRTDIEIHDPGIIN
jgi:hypothetical protein